MKSPRRTMRWVRVCTFIEKEASLCTGFGERKELLEYCTEEQAKARAEGYYDTATYIQHVIDDLEARNA